MKTRGSNESNGSLIDVTVKEEKADVIKLSKSLDGLDNEKSGQDTPMSGYLMRSRRLRDSHHSHSSNDWPSASSSDKSFRPSLNPVQAESCPASSTGRPDSVTSRHSFESQSVPNMTDLNDQEKKPRQAYRRCLAKMRIEDKMSGIDRDGCLMGDVDGIQPNVRRSERKKKWIGNSNTYYMEEDSYDREMETNERHMKNREFITEETSIRHSKRTRGSKVENELRKLGHMNINESDESGDMYSRIKRVPRRLTRKLNDENGEEDTEEDTEKDDSDSETDDVSEIGMQHEEQEEEEVMYDGEGNIRRVSKRLAKRRRVREHETLTNFSEISEADAKIIGKYRLRRRREVTQRMNIPDVVIQPRTRRNRVNGDFGHTASAANRSRAQHSYNMRSPAHKVNSRRRHAVHSSTDSSSTDDERFEKRKSRSMAKARTHCLPMNLNEKDMLKGIFRDRQKVGSSLADIDPMSIDKSIQFNSIGGLDEHVQSLKEMILFPLLYPEVFERFKIQPPRGVLFHGPPGTGKTLVARALANECSQGDRKVAFFMRKGADCLSKWVGESERQLRLLFDQAYMMRPSIIFFDEIDGIAPVRSTRQDQIHSSIVSTLLALMDGLDNRGEVVVIGATNRIDAIDPALRRPGRFDREFYFPAPAFEARKKILSINTSEWQPPLTPTILDQLATLTVGYCGADLKALCAESTLVALRRCFPQIYSSTKKLLLDTKEISIDLCDFLSAMKKIVPSSHRMVSSPARPLTIFIKPLLVNKLKKAIELVTSVFPASIRDKNNGNNITDLFNGKNDALISNHHLEPSSNGAGDAHAQSDLNKLTLSHPRWVGNYRPRFIIHGKKDQGHSTHLGPAILHHFENIPHFKLDLPILHNVATRTPEESLANIFSEAQKLLPSIIYLPHINQWWPILPDALKVTFLTLLDDLEPSLPLLIFATSDIAFNQLPQDLIEIFENSNMSCQTMEMINPNEDERRDYFSTLFLVEVFKPPKSQEKKACKELAYAPTPEPRKLNDKEMKRLRRKEETSLRSLRLYLRDTLSKIMRDRRLQMFSRKVDIEEVPDYYQVIETPMDLETMMAKIDMHQYECAAQFLEDIDLICHNALEYNPDKDPDDKLIRHRACMLRDTAHALIDAEMDSDFENMCQEIHQERVKRGESPTKQAPSNYRVIPINLRLLDEGKADSNETNKNDNKVGKHDEDLTEIESDASGEENTLDGKVGDESVQCANQSTECDEPQLLNGNSNVSQKKRGRRPRRVMRKKPKCSVSEVVKTEETQKNEEKDKNCDFNEENDPNVNKKSVGDSNNVVVQELDRIETDQVMETISTTCLDEAPIASSCESVSPPQSKNELIIDKAMIHKLLERTVSSTQDSSIEELEKLHSSLYLIIMKRRNDWDRSGIVKEIKEELDKFEQTAR